MPHNEVTITRHISPPSSRALNQVAVNARARGGDRNRTMRSVTLRGRFGGVEEAKNNPVAAAPTACTCSVWEAPACRGSAVRARGGAGRVNQPQSAGQIPTDPRHYGAAANPDPDVLPSEFHTAPSAPLSDDTSIFPATTFQPTFPTHGHTKSRKHRH